MLLKKTKLILLGHTKLILRQLTSQKTAKHIKNVKVNTNNLPTITFQIAEK